MLLRTKVEFESDSTPYRPGSTPMAQHRSCLVGFGASWASSAQHWPEFGQFGDAPHVRVPSSPTCGLSVLEQLSVMRSCTRGSVHWSNLALSASTAPQRQRSNSRTADCRSRKRKGGSAGGMFDHVERRAQGAGGLWAISRSLGMDGGRSG